ncbi:MAG: hypothetical protein ABIS03_08595 [Gemmatimonadaceae bacterium]
MLTVLFLAAFLGGLALAVHVMLHGMERWKGHSAASNPPTVAALAAGFGATGYLVTKESSLAPAIVVLIALLAGAAAFAGMTVLMAKWALRDGQPTHSDEDDINGQVAIVTRPISTDTPGEITWHAWNKDHFLPAVALANTDVSIGTEVVIDMVENGIAQVELWSIVEQRL